MGIPPISYAWRDDVALAYQVFGDGPVDIVYLQGYLSNVELNWEHPALARFLNQLARLGRVIVTDRRGLGLSERFTPADTPPTELLMDDIRSVVDSAEAERPVVFASGDCGAMAALFAASYPDRVAGLILYGTNPTVRRTKETPWGLTDEEVTEDSEWVRDQFGSGQWMKRTNPSLVSSAADRGWAARYERLSLTPGSVYTESLRFADTDYRSVLPAIHVPTLVLHRADDPEDDVLGGRFLGERIRTATYRELQGSDHFPWAGDQESVLAEVSTFLHSIEKEESEFNRVLATVMFTDIVESTARVATIGDAEWAKLLERHNEVMRAVFARYRGVEVDTTGDGFMATFDGPGRAVRCAIAAVEAVSGLGLKIRAGCHTGEIQRLGDDVRGVAVHAAARIAAAAEASEILVSRTVKDLVAGGGFEFEDRGTHPLKGVPGEWPLFGVIGPGR